MDESAQDGLGEFCTPYGLALITLYAPEERPPGR